MRSRGNAVVTIPNEEKGSLELKRSKVARLLYAIGGTVALVLAMLGIVVPGLPVTPFALLSAFLYAKSSKRMYDWLLNNRVLGPRIKNYQRRKGLTRKGKAGVIVVMSLMVLFSSFVVIRDNLTVRGIILLLGVIGSLVVWFVVPTAREE
ncbi:MAG: YbaN family protein [Bacteroidota bacterium]|jgi:uncharacterized membrane protein YbaN (DUF454 family)|nr:YbaN family protein [Bacteroidota bacterium]HHU96188.1 DUF454 domain-containing protein [Petrimonas sp.]